MSKKDFIALADSIIRHNKYNDDKFTDNQIRTICSFCSDQNIRFNRERFIDYIKGDCGPNGGKINK
jgi:hypothetical protein